MAAKSSPQKGPHLNESFGPFNEKRAGKKSLEKKLEVGHLSDFGGNLYRHVFFLKSLVLFFFGSLKGSEGWTSLVIRRKMKSSCSQRPHALFAARHDSSVATLSC